MHIPFIQYSPLNANIKVGDEHKKLWQIELRDIARGFCAALFFALPLLYTLEMWARARAMPAWEMAIIILGTYLANVGFGLFNGFKPELTRKSAWLDALTAMGIGLFASAITLALVGQYHAGVPTEIAVKLLLLEMVPTSFGASLAINQLGSRSQGGGQRQMEDFYSKDFQKIMGTTLGALLFAFNIAPTIEPKVITYSTGWWHSLGIMVFSLFVSVLMVFFTNFIERDSKDNGLLSSRWVETAVAYLVSLLVSVILLWMFGYLSLDVPFAVMVRWTVTLGYATTLGGAAGRLLL